MSRDHSSYDGPYPAAEDGRGLDAPYEAVRDQADAAMEDAMAGPKQPLKEPPKVDDLKNPDGEFAIPGANQTDQTGRNGDRPGPLTPQGYTTKDPEGQQGTTHMGGQRDENGNKGSTGTAPQSDKSSNRS